MNITLNPQDWVGEQQLWGQSSLPPVFSVASELRTALHLQVARKGHLGDSVS